MQGQVCLLPPRLHCLGPQRSWTGPISQTAPFPPLTAATLNPQQSLDAAQLAELVERQVAVISSACGALTLDDEEAGEEGAPPLEAPAAATAALESLWAAVKQESATEESRQAVFRLLAALAFLEPGQEAPTPQPTRGSRVREVLEVVPSLDPRPEGEAQGGGMTHLSGAADGDGNICCASPPTSPSLTLPTLSQAKAAAKPGMEDPTMQTLRAAGARGAALRPLAAARLIALADFLAKRPVAPGSAAPSPPLADLVAWVEGALSSGHARLARVGAGALSSTQPLREALSRATASADAGGRGRVAALTHLALLLQLYEWADPSVVDPGVGPDLADVVDRALCQAGAEVDGPRAGVNGDAAPAWHDTLVDVVLSLLARPCSPMPSAPLRNAAESVFRVFATDLTTTGGLGDGAGREGVCLCEPLVWRPWTLLVPGRGKCRVPTVIGHLLCVEAAQARTPLLPRPARPVACAGQLGGRPGGGAG